MSLRAAALVFLATTLAPYASAVSNLRMSEGIAHRSWKNSFFIRRDHEK